jgi:hypothetical protein
MIRVVGQRLPEVGNKIDSFGFFDIFVNFLDFAGCFLWGNSAIKCHTTPPVFLLFRSRHSAWKNGYDSLTVVGLHENWA